MLLYPKLSDNIKMLDNILNIKHNFDLLRRDFIIAERHACLYFVDGFIKDEIMEKVLSFMLRIKKEDIEKAFSPFEFSKRFTTYTEVDIKSDSADIVSAVLSGALALIVDGYDSAVIIDARTYPTRGIKEPEDDRVLRGPRDGFCETMVFNAALLRRHIRDERLCVRVLTAGKRSKTDIALCYMQDIVDKKLLDTVIKKIEDINSKQTASFLIIITKNTALDFLRTDHKNAQESISEDVAYSKDLLEQLLSRLEYQKIVTVIKELKPPYNEVLYLHFVNDLSIRQTAKLLNRKEKTVKMQLVRGKKILVSKLSEVLYE